MKSFRGSRIAPLAAVALLASTAVPADRDGSKDVLLRSLDAELVRSFEGLRQIEGPPLYYLGYQARDRHLFTLNSELGAIAFETTRHDRSVDVDARVGSRKLDNTHQLKGRGGRFEYPRTRYTEITVDDDEAALRGDIWKRTDQVYKDAVNRFTNVQTNKAVTATEEDSSDDFSTQEPSVSYAPVAFPAIDRAAWRERMRRISGAMKPYPFVYNSSADLTVETENRYIVNSEGTRDRHGRHVFLRIWRSGMQSQTDDGMGLYRGRYVRRQHDPTGSALRRRLDPRRSWPDGRATSWKPCCASAPLVDPYTGPGDLPQSGHRGVLPRDPGASAGRPPTEARTGRPDVHQDGRPADRGRLHQRPRQSDPGTLR